MKGKWTPGPWKVGPNNGGELCVYPDTGRPGFATCKFFDIIKPEINQANAHLIAAAPALAEAAQALVDAEDALLADLRAEGRFPDLTEKPWALMNDLRAALALARGEDQ